MRNFLRIGTAFLGLLASSVWAQVQTTAKSYLILDLDNNKVIASKNTEDRRSIASVTKLVTVLTVLDSRAPLDKPLDLTLMNMPKKSKKARRSPYDNITRRELINLAMILSGTI